MSVRLLTALAAPLALAACAVMPYLDAPPASAYNPIEIPDRVFANPDQAVAWYLERTGNAEAEVTTEIGRDPSGRFTRLVLITASGYADDSVTGEQWRLALAQTDIGFRVVQAGIRYNCARGDNPGWSRDLCP
ncbi:hypothetical protein OZN62_09385 [Aurantiacibacter sp. MUD11]|uniref:hypothetical protein n=1 Tax=Aurantiacibacter sp. MUD11 TaxID=3003265 RepID=UPI0022AA41B3|nr:hypothetical protein [Aurantiacibacter sp. MUD11]WAT17146.1 hypothetical protein OZN62_09385 [Aurantiacibacter sp. MUD11]